MSEVATDSSEMLFAVRLRIKLKIVQRNDAYVAPRLGQISSLATVCPTNGSKVPSATSHYSLVSRFPTNDGPEMNFVSTLCALFLLVASASAQEGPKQQVPPLIAKVSERSDFFGEWLRQDGTYKLTIEKGKNGRVIAKYFNPDSINVESAIFRDSENGLFLEIVLRDEGYPGSNYHLFYNSSYRILAGRYLMAQSGQQHEVYFTPVKKP